MGLIKYLKYQELLHQAKLYGMDLVDIDLINIRRSFKKTNPRSQKMEKKRKFYKNNNWLQSPIIISKDYLLVDGYTSYLIAKENNFGLVPVFFR